MAKRQHDIEKYLKGELTPAERHALERQALDDQFLMDALEGGESIHPNELSSDLSSLQQKLNERIGQKARVVPMWVWPARIAAGLAILAVSTFVITQLVQNSSRKELAQTEEAKPKPTEPAASGPAPITDSSTAAAKPDEFLAMDQTKEKKTIKAEPKIFAHENKEVAQSSSYNSSSSGEQVAEEQPVPVVVEQSSLADAEEDADSTQAIAPGLTYQARRDNVATRAKTSDGWTNTEAEKKSWAALATAKPNRVVRGKVTTEDGVGLPGVNVMIKGSSTGTVSDAGGNYQITVDDQQPSLTYSFIGMESKEVEAGDASEVNVQLDADVSELSEVVVVGYGSEAKEAEEIPTLEFATPNGGRAAYKQYLEKNLVYPEQALENKVEGRVTVQFTIQPTGQITDFKVLKGLGYGCDEEVIRLIKAGPKWAPTKQDAEPITDKVKVRMRFRMPKK